MLELGQEWVLYTSPFRLKEVSAAPLGGEIIPDVVSFYAKDKSGTSALYLKDDAGSEREIAPFDQVTGSGAANRLAYWTGTQTLGALPALTSTRVPFSDINGLLTDSANFTRDATSGFVTIKNNTSGAALKLDSSNSAHNTSIHLLVNSSAIWQIGIEAASSKLQVFNVADGLSALQFDNNRNTLVGTGAIATSATKPFFNLNSCAGTPTGNPSPASGQVPLVFDTANNKLYAYNSSWKDITGGAGGGSLTGSGADTQIAYWTALGNLSSSANLIFDRTNIRLGLRVTPSFEFHGQAADGSSFNNTLDCYGTGVVANYRGRAARGTAASFSALQADDSILAISALPGVGTNSFAGGARANIIMKAAENLSGTNQGTYIIFSTTPTGGSTTIAERWRITDGGIWRANGGGTVQGGSGSGDNLTLSSTSNATKGTIFFGGVAALDEVNSRLSLGQTTFAANQGRLLIAGTVTNSNSGQSVLALNNTFNGSAGGGAGEMYSFQLSPTFSPSGSIAFAGGFRGDITFSPGGGVTITDCQGGRLITITGSSGGAITNLAGLQLLPSYGSVKPTNAYGLDVLNFGSASITKAVGIRIALPTGATNNYYIELDTGDGTDPTGGGGAATGRIPVLIGGTLRYLAYY